MKVGLRNLLTHYFRNQPACSLILTCMRNNSDGHTIATDVVGSVCLTGESCRTLMFTPPGPCAGGNDVVIMRYGVEQP